MRRTYLDKSVQPTVSYGDPHQIDMFVSSTCPIGEGGVHKEKLAW
jgi:hypothetical protein